MMMIKQLDTKCRLTNKNIIIHAGQWCGFGNNKYEVGQDGMLHKGLQKKGN